jgi:hypothetical protein
VTIGAIGLRDYNGISKMIRVDRPRRVRRSAPRLIVAESGGSPFHLMLIPCMHCTCVRHTELPNTSTLFADVLYHPDRTAGFYRHPFRELSSFQDAAREIDLSDDRRAALIAALREQNPESPALAKLAQRGTVAVVTGQQVGLFSARTRCTRSCTR